MTRSIDGQQAGTPPPRTSRRAGRGGKLRLAPSELQSHPIAGAWLESIQRLVGSDDMEWGLRIAVAGRVRTLEVGPGVVSANVSEEGEGGRRVTLSVPMIHETDWIRLVEAMASEAVYTARFIEGEFPPNLVELFKECEVDLVPGPGEDIMVRTTTDSNESSHRRAAAVGWLAAERLAIEPLRILDIRGYEVTHLVDRIRRVRSQQLAGGGVAHPEPGLLGIQEAAVPLGESVEHYWRIGSPQEQVEARGPGHHIPHALLRRLGQSPMEGKFPLSGLLATIYDLVAERSRAILEGPEDRDTAN